MTSRQPPSESGREFCARAQELALMRLDPEPAFESVSEADERFLVQHLSDCAHCRAAQLTMANLTESLRDLDLVEPPVGLADRITAALEADAPDQAPVVLATPRFNRQKALPVAAALLALAVAVPLLLNGNPSLRDNQLAYRSAPAQQPAEPQSLLIPSPDETAEVPDPLDMHGTPPMSPTAPHVTSAMPVRTDGRNVSHPSAPARKAASASGSAPRPGAAMEDVLQSTDAQQPGEQLAMAGPGGALMDWGGTFSGESEGDVYYDPVSDLVGF